MAKIAIKGRRIFITGGTGFVGSHVVELLLSKGAHIFVPFRSIDPRSYFSLKKLDRRVVLIAADMKERHRIQDCITKYEIDDIIHLAAQPIVTTAFQNPLETLESNIMGTAFVLEAARSLRSIPRIIIASSDKAYGKSSSSYTEHHPLAGDHPYEVSKSAADLIAQSYSKTYNMPVIITRFGNIYGPGDLNMSRIIPGAFKAALTKTPLHLRSDGTFVRDYVYVKDVALCYEFLLTAGQAFTGEAYNISTNDSLSVSALVKKVGHIIRLPIRVVVHRTAVNEIPYQHLSWEKIAKLGWKPRYTFPRGIKESYLWYKKQRKVL